MLIKLKWVALIAPLLATAVTIIIGVMMTNTTLSVSLWGVIGWAISPYIYLIMVIKRISKTSPLILLMALALLLSGFGIWAFIDALFIHPDAQGGLIFMVVPVWQWAVLLLATLPVYFLNKIKI